MDYLFLQDFLISFSIPTVIVAIIVCTVSLTLNKFFDKLPKLLRVYIPFLMAIVLYYAYDIIFVIKDFSFRIESLYAGLLSASLSAILSTMIKKIISGKGFVPSATILLIEGILEGYLNQDELTSVAIEIEKDLLLIDDDQQIESSIINRLVSKCENLTISEGNRLAKLIISAVKSIDKT